MRKQIKKPFSQVAVWHGTEIGDTPVEEFNKFFKDQFNVRVNFIEEVKTAPDTDDKGFPVEGTGGRSDVFFSVHEEDIPKFAVKRFQLQDPPRWIEDVYANGGGILYPQDIENYKTWEAGDQEDE
jgi:hypothetical protein